MKQKFNEIDFKEMLTKIVKDFIDIAKVVSDSSETLKEFPKLTEDIKKIVGSTYKEEFDRFKAMYVIAKAQERFRLDYMLENYVPKTHNFLGIRYNSTGRKLYDELCKEFDEFLTEGKDKIKANKALKAQDPEPDVSTAVTENEAVSSLVPTPDIAPPAPIAEPTPPVQAEQQPQTMFTVPNGNNGADIVVGVGIRTNQQQSQQQQQNSPPPTATVPPKEYDFEPQQPPSTN